MRHLRYEIAGFNTNRDIVLNQKIIRNCDRSNGVADVVRSVRALSRRHRYPVFDSRGSKPRVITGTRQR